MASKEEMYPRAVIPLTPVGGAAMVNFARDEFGNASVTLMITAEAVEKVPIEEDKPTYQVILTRVEAKTIAGVLLAVADET